jgi:hypothetical protein
MTLRGLPVINNGDELGMREMYRRLIHMRQTCGGLSVGDYRSLDVGNDNVYGFVREAPLQRFLVLLNFGNEATNLELRGPVGTWIVGTHEIEGDGLEPQANKVALRPYEGRVYEMVQTIAHML